MARITAAQYDAYTGAIAKISGAAREQVETRLRSWLAGNPGATVGEVREMLDDLLRGIGSVYSDAASELAAQWYDETVVSSNAKLGEAVTVSRLTNERIERRSRGLAGIYAQGRIESLVRAAGDVADNEVRKTVNETVLANARRDRKENIRFARVTGPGENCPWCTMLASRGAVYYTRKTAGEFDHWHANCRCTVVAGYEDDPMACLVEGHDPKDELRRWNRIQEARGTSQVVYSQKAKTLERDLLEYEEGLKAAWKSCVLDGKTAESYRRHYVSYVKSVAGESVEVEDFVKLEPKELQEAKWLTEFGERVLLRDPNMHGNTSDALVGGTLCDFKKIESSNIRKIAQRVTDKLDRQGPAFLVDLSASGIEKEEAEVQVAVLLDDPRVERIYMVKNGRIELFEK